MIYDYLFYKGYQLAKKSKNWEDTPTLFAIMIIGACFIMNFATILFIIEGLSKEKIKFGDFISKINHYKYITGSIIMISIWLSYSYKNRWRKIIVKYKAKEKKKGKSIHPAIPLIITYIVSILLAMFAAMYKNGDGIFG
ncbi:hypothetical protein [Sphingobacterium humi]|uniref:Uncharacterized protein n=1 Tax=Sphingobacterium humi TaxID=1796905 RepID=A0A6N8L5Q1_9SPHI|nr:hypothetical protein [Sphingobacterium humi]MVZ63771.1 hypothetical protein [Sphingobacterium humi]